MADEDINPVVLLADPKVNHRVWAACLKWTPVVKKQRVPSHHKHKSHVKPRRLTSLKVTVGSRNSRGKISRLTGTGILTRPERNHYFSLALAFCSWANLPIDVVLPHPFGPRRPKVLFFSISKLMLFTAIVDLNFFTRFFTSNFI